MSRSWSTAMGKTWCGEERRTVTRPTGVCRQPSTAISSSARRRTRLPLWCPGTWIRLACTAPSRPAASIRNPTTGYSSTECPNDTGSQTSPLIRQKHRSDFYSFILSVNYQRNHFLSIRFRVLMGFRNDLWKYTHIVKIPNWLIFEEM